MSQFSPLAKPFARQKAVERLIAELSADTRPILLGPWRSEVGFEGLYWIPFLTFLASKVPAFDTRAVVVTRGGLAPLYRQVASQGYDLYALRSVVEVRRENAYDATYRHSGKTIKQLTPTPWDDAVLADAAAALGLGTLYHVIHPAWCYWALAPFWEETAGLQYLSQLTDYTPLPTLPVSGSLPPTYVAMKFYARATFPYPDPQVGAFVQDIVAKVAAQVPVVLLSSAPDFDDHADLVVTGTNVHRLPTDIPPEENLKLQVAVLSHAKAFIGTYGGVAQLALRLGVPSVSFYTEFGGTAHAHLALSSWLSKTRQTPFLVGSLADTLLWRQVVAGQRAIPQVPAA